MVLKHLPRFDRQLLEWSLTVEHQQCVGYELADVMTDGIWCAYLRFRFMTANLTAVVVRLFSSAGGKKRSVLTSRDLNEDTITSEIIAGVWLDSGGNARNLSNEIWLRPYLWIIQPLIPRLLHDFCKAGSGMLLHFNLSSSSPRPRKL